MKEIIALASAACILSSCNNMNTQASSSAADSTIAAFKSRDSVLARNKTVVLSSLEAFSSGKVEDIFKDFASDAVDFGDGIGQPRKGLDSIKATAKSFMAAFPDIKGTDFVAIADGNHVAVFGTWTATFKNPIMGIKPTNKTFKVNDVDLYTFNDAGKISEHRSVQTDAALMAQLGVKTK